MNIFRRIFIYFCFCFWILMFDFDFAVQQNHRPIRFLDSLKFHRIYFCAAPDLQFHVFWNDWISRASSMWRLSCQIHHCQTMNHARRMFRFQCWIETISKSTFISTKSVIWLIKSSSETENVWCIALPASVDRHHFVWLISWSTRDCRCAMHFSKFEQFGKCKNSVQIHWNVEKITNV